MKCKYCDDPIRTLLKAEMQCFKCYNRRAGEPRPTTNLCIRHPDVGKFPGRWTCPKCLALGVGSGERVSQEEFDKVMLEYAEAREL